MDETLRLVQAFQYTDKHGEVCPAGWKPGADTIVPDPKEKLDYFTKHDEEEATVDSWKDEMWNYLKLGKAANELQWSASLAPSGILLLVGCFF